jgi:peptidyl-prolyl cis-trans isomerase A (cyclophilin A)
MKEFFVNSRLLVLTLLPGFLLGSCSQKNPQIIIKTELGNITVELYPGKAPLTANNFLKYVNENRLKDATFYRTVTLDNQPDSKVLIEVIQGGLYEDNHPQALPPIEHETTEMTGILHKDGVISLARYGPGSATCEFFICLGDQPSLDYGGDRNGDGQGFAAFGKVVDGMDVVYKIHQSTSNGQYLDPWIKINSVELVK